MKLEEVREKLRAMPEVTHAYADRHNPSCGDVEADIVPAGSRIERNIDGCSTCGHGDSIIVRGVLT